MSYEKHEWVNGEIITADKLNNIEEGIEEAKESTELPTEEEIDDLFDGFLE